MKLFRRILTICLLANTPASSRTVTTVLISIGNSSIGPVCGWNTLSQLQKFFLSNTHSSDKVYVQRFTPTTFSLLYCYPTQNVIVLTYMNHFHYTDKSFFFHLTLPFLSFHQDNNM
jgi:hypothetical protein